MILLIVLYPIFFLIGILLFADLDSVNMDV